MPDLLHASGPTTFGTANIGGRNYDYTKIYSPDKQGEEAKENARVWNVYLDEAENYDADMIQGFRNIIDGLLVFAALFSAVVTTFVAQTSQALQPDNAQIMVSLLVENNQLLRVAGNRTSISAVPGASLGLGSRTYTSIDIWVNGLFFTSLALSLSTALLTVLAKQWIQAYTAIVPGGAKTRALTRHFRFQGLMKWKLGDVIESLPLILHGSVAIFLVGLALYVWQLSSPICGVVSAITALTFLFYFGTSMIPAFDIGCPYRIPFMFSLAQSLSFVFPATKYTFLCIWHIRTGKSHWVLRSSLSRSSLKMAEHREVFDNTDSFACDSLGWVINHSSNHSVKGVVIEGACGLLDETFSDSPYRSKGLISSSQYNNLFLSAVKYSLSQLPNMSSIFTTEEEVEKSTYGRLIGSLMKISSSKSLFDEPLTGLKDWEREIERMLMKAYEKAVEKRYHALSRRLLDWGHPNLLQSGPVLFFCAQRGDGENIRDLVDRGMNLDHHDYDGWTALHHAASSGNINTAVALVEQDPRLISVQTNDIFFKSQYTALELAIKFGKSDVAAYFLDHHGSDHPPSDALQVHVTVGSPFILQDSERLETIEFLLDRGWDRTAKDIWGRTPIDIARRSEGYDVVVEHLEHYQTVRLPPHTSLIQNGSKGET
ncbi:hypothetical protein C0995_015400 [Termitomyces sp. Mi166|nr:hypothetical protein C0995_015400 [Termitomyces sp. Mi166\